MGRRILQRWEGLSGRAQVLVGIPLAWIVLFAFHEAFFPLLTVRKSFTYACMECVPIALVLAWATQNELRRRALAVERAESHAHGQSSAVHDVDSGNEAPND